MHTIQRSWDIGSWQLPAMVGLADGTQILIHPVGIADAAAEWAHIDALAPQVRRNQYLGPSKRTSGGRTEQFTDLDHDHSVAFAALVRDGEQDTVAGVGRYTATLDGTSCECAVTVLDDWQKSGLVSLLMVHLIGAAESRGITRMWSTDSAAFVAMNGAGASSDFKAHQ